MSKQLDYILVGQGLAGTLLSYFLLKQGKRVLVIDQTHPHTASRVAAGLINPITGRRYVKSWKIDDLLPFAEQTYQELEALLGITFYKRRPILRTLFNSREENDWLLRTADDGYTPYMEDQAQLGGFEQHTVAAYAYGEVRQAAQADLPTLVQHYREWLKTQDALLESDFNYADLKVKDSGVRYQDWQAKRILFCEGAAATQNPFFNYLPFGGAKGEVLIIHIPEVQFEKSLKHRVFITPLADKTYWIGASYEWKFKDALPTPEGKQFLLDRLSDFLKPDFEVLAHRSAIRPTVKDRRPFLGVHPEQAALFIFNGLGTKGASLGPYFARQMVDYLEAGQALDPAVDIQRFAP